MLERSRPRVPHRPRFHALGRYLRRLLTDRRGVFAVELALATPVLAGLTLGGVEITRFVLLNQKIERTSATMADLVSQSEILTEQNIIKLFDATSQVMTPFDINTDGRLILSSVSADGGGPPKINWQRAYGAPGSASHLGSVGATALLPAGFQVRDSESVIVAEVFYNYTPLFTSNLIAPVNLYNLAVYRPRFGSLTSIQP